MKRTLTLILGVALFGILAAVVVASQGADDPVGTTDTVTETVERTTTTEDNPARERADDDGQAGVDISGPCDEAEHANDPRCTGEAPAQHAPAQTGVDISGPCDEAEHANDPRCTGAPSGRVDNSGPGSANSGRDDDGDFDDHRGDDDHSGHGGGGDDDSGHGRGRGRGRGGDDD